MRRVMYLCVLFALTPIVTAADLDSVVIYDSSGFYDGEAYPNSRPVQTISGAGLDTGTGLHDTNYQNMWLSDAYVDSSSWWIIYDMGGVAQLSGITYWNGNRINRQDHCPTSITFLASADPNFNDEFEDLGTFTTAGSDITLPPCTDPVGSDSLAVSPANNLRYVKLIVNETVAGTTGRATVSEIRFDGVLLVPVVTILGDDFADGQIGLRETDGTVDTSIDYFGDPNILTYTWSVLDGPGTATFTPNGTLAAASTTVDFSTYGDYEIQVLVDDGSITNTDTMLVKVLPDDYVALEGGLSIADTSGYDESFGGDNGKPENVINQSGFTTSSDGLLALNDYSLLTYQWITTNDDTDEDYIVVDLGQPRMVNYVQFWNGLAQDPYWEQDVEDLEISFSNDPNILTPTYTTPIPVTLDPAIVPDDSAIDYGKIVATNLTEAKRYMYLRVISNYWDAGAKRTRFSELGISIVPQDCQDVLDLGYTLTYDYNDDCETNLEDMAMFISEWLKCYNPAISGCEEPWL